MRSSNRPAAVQRIAPDKGMAEIEELLKSGDVESATKLQQISLEPDRNHAKAARSALYKLRLKGIHPRAVAGVQRGAREEPRELIRTALLTQFGGAGSRMLLFVRDDPHGGSPSLITFLINDERGLLDLGARKLSRKQLDENLNSFSSREGTVVAEIPLDYARFLLQDAASLTQRLRSPLPGGYSEWRVKVGDPVESHARSPIYILLDQETVKKDLGISRSPETLFERPWCRGWLIDVESLVPWLEQIVSASETRLVLDESQQTQRVERIIDDATDAIMTADAITRWRRRLEESAYVLQLAGQADDAAAAFFQAMTLEEARTPHMMPFPRALVKRSIAVVLSAQREDKLEEPEKTSLIERI